MQIMVLALSRKGDRLNWTPTKFLNSVQSPSTYLKIVLIHYNVPLRWMMFLYPCFTNEGAEITTFIDLSKVREVVIGGLKF